MAKWFALLLALGLLPPAAAEETPPDILVSVPEGHPLIGFVRGDLGEAYRRIGLHMVLKPLPSARSIEAANLGETDAEAGRVQETGQNYANLREVPVPLLEMDILAVTNGVPLTVSGWDSLKGRHLCIGLGDKLVERRTIGMNPESARSLESLVRMLKAGRCEVAIFSQFMWPDIDRLHLGPLCPASEPVEKAPLYHYVNSRHADLVPRLTEVLTALRQDGTAERAFAPIRAEIEQAAARNISCAGATGAGRP